MIRAVDGTELGALVRGEGPAVLLCNGAGEPATQWDDVLVPPLLAADCTVVAWDYRGVAPSGDPARPATVADMVDDAVSVVEGVDRGPVVAVGYSSGGWVATEAAARRPDLVRAVVTIAGIGPAPAVEQEWLAGVRAAGGATEPGGAVRATPRHWSAWEEWVGGDPEVHLEALGRLEVPVQVICFGDDPYLTPAMAAAATRRLRRGELHVVHGCGHTGLWDRPDLVVPLVVGFVTGPKAAGPATVAGPGSGAAPPGGVLGGAGGSGAPIGPRAAGPVSGGTAPRANPRP